jgi:hypothetical protein
MKGLAKLAKVSKRISLCVPKILGRVPVRTLRVVAVLLAVVAGVLFVLGLSFYFRGFPSTPDVGTGRIFPLNNHGRITYLTHGEWLTQRAAPVLAWILFVLGVYLNKAVRSPQTNRNDAHKGRDHIAD